MTLSAILLNIAISIEFLLVIYLLALGPCLFGRYVNLKNDALTNPDRSSYLNKRAKSMPLMISFCVVTVIAILVYNNKLDTLIFGVGIIIMSFFYDLFLKGLTKKVVGFKNIFVGFLFSSLVVMLVMYYGKSFGISFYLVYIFLFLMTAMGAAFSDIKDINGDKKEGLKTLAIVLGQKKLIKILIFIILIALVPLAVGVYYNQLPTYALMLVLVLPYNIFLFKESLNKNTNTDFLYAVLFDSQLILWLVLVLIGRVLV
ncbi:MAG: UbiA family prenyltransferase [Candidatus Saccharimonadales bacterium]